SRAIATFLFTLLWDALTMYLLFFGVDIHEKVDFCTGGTSTSGVFGYYFAIVSMIIGIGVVVLYICIVIGIHRAARDRDRKSMAETQKAVFKRTSTIIITYMIFWCIPSLVNFVVTCFLNDENLHTPSEVLVTVGSGLNSLANVIIYFVKSPDIRKMVVKVLPKRFRGESTNRIFVISQTTKSNGPSSAQVQSRSGQ
uniref:G-protein coupled receptors family 1 profile domain-containing protein n=1 Tax=Acrobeloides nanus TaxID=290746 RepID=A0A914EJ76_9BILA